VKFTKQTRIMIREHLYTLYRTIQQLHIFLSWI